MKILKTLSNLNTDKKEDTYSAVDICERISKISIYALVFLLPLLFLPWTANVLEFNKQALLIVLVFASFFAWMLKVLISGRAKVNIGLAYLPAGLFLIVYLLSTIFSWSRYGSFWGWPLVTSESLATVISLFLLYVLIINVFNKKEIFYLASTLALSGLAVAAYGVLQLFGQFIFSISFTKSTTFNTVGGVINLGFFAAVLMPLSMMLVVMANKNLWRVLFAVSILLEAAILLLVNSPVVWWLAIIGSALVFAFAMQRRDIFDSRWLIMPMFFLALALLFSFFKFSIPGVPERNAEAYLKHSPTVEIALQSVKENPVFGTGAGTFKYAFTKYKSLEFNQSNFWNISFDWGSSKFLTLLTTVGILGVLGFLAIIAFFIYFGMVFLFRKRGLGGEGLNENATWNLGVGLLIGFFVISTGYFLYSSNITIDFIYFVLMALFVGLVYPVKKEFVLKSSSLSTLIFTFAVTILFVFGLGILILEGQRYVSAANYLSALKGWQEKKTESSLGGLDKAAKINPAVDLYWRELSQSHLSYIDIVADNKDLSQQDKSRLIQISVNKAVASAKTATEVNPKNVSNWSNRGYIYQNLIGVVPGTMQWAVEAYEKASELDPANPFYYTQAGVSILREAGSLGEEGSVKKTEFLEEAKRYFEKSIELKPDYASAHFQIARIYLDQKKDAEMIASFEKAKESAPGDVGIAFQLGLIYYQRKDFEKAKAELERAIYINPNYANALYFLGLSYDKLNKKDLAKAAFQRILQLNPGNELAVNILKNLESGKKALEGISEEEIPEAPIEEDEQ